MTAIILAGGRSSRMGSDKAFLEIGGIPIIEREIAVLKEIFEEVILVVRDPKKYSFQSIKTVGDIIKDYGPLGGIHAGLLASKTFHNFVVACDTPFLNERVIRYIIGKSRGYDIAIPEIDGKLHPLFGVYSKDCIPAIEDLVKEDLHRVASLYARVKTRFISKDEIAIFDNDLRSLVNINTKEEALEACRR